MKYATSILILLCLFGFSNAVWGQNANSHSASGILGYLDPHDGTFRPMQRLNDQNVTGAQGTPAVYNGTFVLNLSADSYSSFPDTEVYTCSFTASTFDMSALIFTETATIMASRNGHHFTCSVYIPYYWKLSSPNTDMVTLEYSLNATNANGSVPIRVAQHSLPSIAVPSPGAVTHLSDYLQF